jgi:uridine kinase
LGRYRLEVLIEHARKVASGPTRFDIEYPQYDRKLKQVQKSKKVSIGPSDIVILEGVPALLDKRLLDLANLSIHIDVDDTLRMKRLHEEYLWREERREDFMKKIMSREIDEVSLIKSAADKADYQINF